MSEFKKRDEDKIEHELQEATSDVGAACAAKTDPSVLRD